MRTKVLKIGYVNPLFSTFFDWKESFERLITWHTSHTQKEMQLSAFRRNSGNSREFVCYGSGWGVIWSARTWLMSNIKVPSSQLWFFYKSAKNSPFSQDFQFSQLFPEKLVKCSVYKNKTKLTRCVFASFWNEVLFWAKPRKKGRKKW